MEAQAEVKKLIITWAATRPDEIVSEHRNGFYSADIVIDAYKEGYSKGKNSNTPSFIEQIRAAFYKKADLLGEAISDSVTRLHEMGFDPSKMFINHNLDESRVLMAFNPDISQDRSFIDFSYSQAKELEEKYFAQKLSVIIGFIDDSEHLNLELLHSDGYVIGYDFNKSEPIEFND